MRRIAIVKPDHIGDLVLAVPVINWLAQRSGETTLLVQPTNLALARRLFPAIEVASVTLHHLQKGAHGAERSLAANLRQAGGKDLCVFLRSDHILSRERVRHIVGPCIFSDGQPGRHETANHRYGVRDYFGDFDAETYWPGCRRPFPKAPAVVGLCVGSGFPSNKWSVIRWTELGQALARRGVKVRLIGGPQERAELALLASTIGIERTSIIEGGDDIGAFIERVGEVDLTIASDGGAGHLCSLASPVLSIAASVPFRRFAPFGAQVRVVSLDLPCSPCLNSHDTHINMCFSHECSYGITVRDVLTALDAPDAPPGTVHGVGSQAKLFYGISHAA